MALQGMLETELGSSLRATLTQLLRHHSISLTYISSFIFSHSSENAVLFLFWLESNVLCLYLKALRYLILHVLITPKYLHHLIPRLLSGEALVNTRLCGSDLSFLSISLLNSKTVIKIIT